MRIVRHKEAPKAFLPWEILHEPVQEGACWVVAAEDQVLGVMERKKFRTKGQALDFYTSVLLGKAAEAGRIDSHDGSAPATDLAQSGKARFDPRGRHTDGINLQDVGRVLASYGLDPIAEIAGILVPYDVVDEDGEVAGQNYQLDAKERVKALLELTQYVRPKLKAVEVKVTGDELNEKQVDAKLQALLAKALKRDS
jgi:hypothetical protein